SPTVRGLDVSERGAVFPTGNELAGLPLTPDPATTGLLLDRLREPLTRVADQREAERPRRPRYRGRRGPRPSADTRRMGDGVGGRPRPGRAPGAPAGPAPGPAGRRRGADLLLRLAAGRRRVRRPGASAGAGRG